MQHALLASKFGSGLAHSAIVVSLLSKTAMRTSPKDTPCLYCGKMLTARGVAEHERHAWKKNLNRRKRTFGKKKCDVWKKPSSRAAQRREMAARASSVRSHERSTSPKASGERREYTAGRHRKHSHHPHTAFQHALCLVPSANCMTAFLQWAIFQQKQSF